MHYKMFVVLLSILGSYAEAGNSSRCYSIQDPDRRQACLAETQRNPSRCYNIRDMDSRNICLSSTTQNTSRCYAIREPDRRQACLAGMPY